MRALVIAVALVGCAAAPTPNTTTTTNPNTTTTPPIGEPIGAACGKDQSPCGNGPHAACCNTGETCCAGGAAGSYYCMHEKGECPPLP